MVVKLSPSADVRFSQRKQNCICQRYQTSGCHYICGKGYINYPLCCCGRFRKTIPPIFLFRKRFKPFFMTNAPVSSTGEANGSGWMEADTFFIYILGNMQGLLSKKVLLILDNHRSHLGLQTTDFCRENGIVLLSFPPHTSHKLQPLDRTVYGVLKSYLNNYMDAWMKNSPGKTMTIYDLPGLIAEALPVCSVYTNRQLT